jgi:hypothetical protein
MVSMPAFIEGPEDECRNSHSGSGCCSSRVVPSHASNSREVPLQIPPWSAGIFLLIDANLQSNWSERYDSRATDLAGEKCTPYGDYLEEHLREEEWGLGEEHGD